jgi:hypothetical protein
VPRGTRRCVRESCGRTAPIAGFSQQARSAADGCRDQLDAVGDGTNGYQVLGAGQLYQAMASTPTYTGGNVTQITRNESA